MHKLVFEDDVLPDGTEVAYYSHGKVALFEIGSALPCFMTFIFFLIVLFWVWQKLLVGYKKGYGIFCTCCNAEVSASQFEAHAGWASRRKP